MKITLVCTLLAVTFLHGSNQQCLTLNDVRMPNPKGQFGLYSGQQAFSLSLLQAINQLSPDDNLFFSPYSTYHALLLAYFISAGQTEKYLRKALRLDSSLDKADIFNAYKFDRLATKIRAANGTYEFTSANRLYVGEQVTIRDCVPHIFKEELMIINFHANPEAARETINGWVELHTHDMIKDLLPPGSVDKQTNLVLVNAAYFKGKWESKFNSGETTPELFYTSISKQTIVDMMHIESTFNYDVSESLKAHILELPYEGNDISMYILLPPFLQDSVETVLKKLTLENFQKVVNGSLSPRQVEVALPKFSLEHTVELVPVLEKIGVGDLFTSGSDFSVLSDSKQLTLGDGLHKAQIEVSEEGTKAAAATALLTFRSSRPLEPAQFKCNHPFVYVVFDKTEQSILFTGVFRRPF